MRKGTNLFKNLTGKIGGGYISFLSRSHLSRTPAKTAPRFYHEDLRIMIGQNFSLEYLVPLAIEQLQRGPLAAGDFYPGDLLGSVLKVESSFWKQRPDLQQAVEAIVALIPDFPDILDKKLLVFRQTG